MINLSKVVYHWTNTWPSYNELKKESNITTANFMRKIYEKGVFQEIDRIFNKFPECSGVGHIALIVICCALDSLAAYADGSHKDFPSGPRFKNFIQDYFSERYMGSEKKLYKIFRCLTIHGWHIHKGMITGSKNDQRHLKEVKGVFIISLYDLFNDLKQAFEKYCKLIEIDEDVKNKMLRRYKYVRRD